MKNKKCIMEIDAKFADIQKYINELDFLDDAAKENMISLCIACNDVINKNVFKVIN